MSMSIRHLHDTQRGVNVGADPALLGAEPRAKQTQPGAVCAAVRALGEEMHSWHRGSDWPGGCGTGEVLLYHILPSVSGY